MKDHDANNPVSLTHILAHWAMTKPDATAYIFLADGEHETHSISYAELYQRSAGLAKKLQTIGSFGDRMLMFYPTGIEFVVAFYGCLHAGLIPVPAYAPKKNAKQDRIDKIIIDCSPAAILGTADIIHRLSDADHPLALNGLPTLLATDAEQYTTTDLSIPEAITSSTLACLQYTSGSTGSPKGVMLTHENFIRNQQFTQKNWQHDHTSDWMCWLPLFHDMGLGNIVQTLYLGSCCILIPPETFVQKPIRWLNAISRYAAHTSGGPDFAYALCAEIAAEDIPADLDLSRWKVAYNGAEPINPNSLLKFTEKFSRFGFCAQAFSPCYGLAEATLAVTAVHKDQHVESINIDVTAFAENRVVVVSDTADGRVLVSSGVSPSDDSVRVVDPNTFQSLPEDAIGEIWCCSGGVGQGYWNNIEATRSTFQASLASTTVPHYMRTGDLGFFHAGQLYVTGRLKDVIIIRGKNYYPQDIEFSCSGCHTALVHGGTTAFVDSEQSTDKVIIFQEVKRTQLRGTDFEQVLTQIKKTVATEHGLALQAIYLLKPGQLPRTSSGKVRRAECLKKLRAKEILSIAHWQSGPATDLPAEARSEPLGNEHVALRSQAQISQWFVETLTTKFAISQDAIKSDANFAELGLDSITITILAQLLTEFVRQPISATQLFDYPTLGELSAHLADTTPLQSRKSPGHPALHQHQYAIVGMACDFPGAPSLEAYWQMISAGEQGFAPLEKRWREVGGANGSENARAGIIDDIFMFDAKFFRISDEEARAMDPQQRLLLSTAWEALEHATLSPAELAGSDIGVFIGISSNDYSRGLLDHADTPYFLTGSALSLSANRISYVFDFKGPSLAIDTACSSSLVALHNALNSLANHECELALVGGVNALLSPPVDASFNKAGMTSKTSSSRIFDAAADGYVRGEGCGVLIIKRLTDAQHDNDRILAVITGSAVNQDGRSNGLTAPNGLSQQKVIHKALDRSGLTPDAIDYIETHGTGTVLGDPIEVNALGAALCQGRTREQALTLGSVKANLGHLESAAGMAGIIKVVMALQHKVFPPQANFSQPNPRIRWDEFSLSVPTQLTPWPANGRPRTAGVSGFGFGGTNAHVILQEAPARAERVVDCSHPRHLLTLSAQSEASLTALQQKYASQLRRHPELPPQDLCFSANTGRAALDYRAVFTGRTLEELQQQLHDNTLSTDSQPITDAPQIAFLFTGQGAQYVGMGKALYANQPIFRETIDRCGDYILAQEGWSLVDLLYADDAQAALLDQTQYTQPALFCIEYALATLWMSWGITPSAVMGHSIGEYVAACVAQVFSLEDGLKLVIARGRLMQSLPAGGAMAAVRAGQSVVQAVIAPFNGSVSIAALNSSSQTVISGDADSIAHCCEILTAQQVRTVQLSVSHAFHSARLEPILDAFEKVADEVTYQAPKIALISNLTAGAVTADALCARYWRDHARQPVAFARGLETLASLNCQVWLEMGPHPVLMELAATQMPAGVSALATLNRRRDDWDQTLETLGALYRRGWTPDWKAFYAGCGAQQAELPTYAWSKKYFNYHSSPRVNAAAAVQKNQDAEPFITPPEINNLTYQIDWIAQDKAATNSSPLERNSRPHWVIFADDNALSNAVLEKIKTLDPAPVVLSRANALYKDAAHTLCVDTRDLLQARTLLKERISKDDRAISGVIYLWNEPLSRQEFEHEVIEQTCNLTHDALFAMQLILPLQPALTDGFNMATRGAFWITSPINTEPSIAELVQAPLSGLMKTLSHEAPGLRPRLLDLPAHKGANQADIHADALTLLDEIISDNSGEFQVAFREHKRYVARLNQSTPVTETTLKILPDAAYLVTGGLGDIGLKLCEWLIEQGARHLVLVNRSGITTAHQHSSIAHLRGLGATLTLHSADISAAEEITRIMEITLQGTPPLKGIFHCAGTSGAMTKIGDLHWADLKRTMAPKVDATWRLYQASKALPLDFFVSFSSISAVWGASGLGAYAGANMFLEAFSLFTRNNVIPATAVNWGPWKQTGMANAPGLAASLETCGIKPLHPDICLNILNTLLGANHRPITVTDTSWPQFRKVLGVLGMGRMFEHLQPERATPAKESVNASSGTRLSPAAAITRADIEQYLKDEVGELLVLPKQHTISRRTGFFDMGMDSVLATELLARIKQTFGIELSSTAIFENPTIQALTDQIISCLPSIAKQPSTVFTESSPLTPNLGTRHSRAEIEVMSEQEALELLQASLRSSQ